MTNMMDRFSS